MDHHNFKASAADNTNKSASSHQNKTENINASSLEGQHHHNNRSSNNAQQHIQTASNKNNQHTSTHKNNNDQQHDIDEHNHHHHHQKHNKNDEHDFEANPSRQEEKAWAKRNSDDNI